jgi:uncharacterized protein YcbX
LGVSFFRIGDQVQLHYNKPCNKCSIVTVDPQTGIKDPDGEPLKTMKTFRFLDPDTKNPDLAEKRRKIVIGPPLSILCGCGIQGQVQVGDPVYVQF